MKTSNFLKRSLFIGCTLLSVLNLFAGEITIKKGDDPTNPTQPNSMTAIYPVTATEDNETMAVYFEEAVGDATLRVYNASNQVVYQTVIDTDSQSAATIDISAWSSGDYTLTINYGTTNLFGEFIIE